MIQSKESHISRIICLSGWKGSGKDTVASYLENEYGYTPLSFASALKDMVADIYRIDRSLLDDPLRKEDCLYQFPVIDSDRFTQMIHNQLAAELSQGYWTPRALAILEGSVKRSVNSGFWTSRVLSVISANPHTNYVITDMRYKSEAEATLQLFPEAALVRLERFSTVNTSDPSERDLDNYGRFTATIRNTGTVKDLYDQIEKYLIVGGSTHV